MKTAEILNMGWYNSRVLIYIYLTNSNTTNIKVYKTVGTKDEYIGQYELTKTSSNIGYIDVTGVTDYDASYKIRECIKGKSTQKSEPKSLYSTTSSQCLGGYYLVNFQPCKNRVSTLILRKSVVRKVVTIDIIANIKYKKSFVDILPAKGTQAYEALDILKIKGKLEFAPILGTSTDQDTGETIDGNEMIRNYLIEHADEF